MAAELSTVDFSLFTFAYLALQSTNHHHLLLTTFNSVDCVPPNLWAHNIQVPSPAAYSPMQYLHVVASFITTVEEDNDDDEDDDTWRMGQGHADWVVCWLAILIPTTRTLVLWPQWVFQPASQPFSHPSPPVMRCGWSLVCVCDCVPWKMRKCYLDVGRHIEWRAAWVRLECLKKPSRTPHPGWM